MFYHLLDYVIVAIEVAGVLVMIVGLVWASIAYARVLRQTAGHPDGRKGAFRAYRANVGRSILLALEFLVAADIIKTVVMEPTLDSVVVLGVIVLVRTFLSFTLEVEIDGRWPWQQPPAHREGRI